MVLIDDAFWRARLQGVDDCNIEKMFKRNPRKGDEDKGKKELAVKRALSHQNYFLGNLATASFILVTGVIFAVWYVSNGGPRTLDKAA